MKSFVTVESKEIHKMCVKIIDDIVNCLFLAEEENIPPVFKNLLLPPIQDSLLKLQDKFNKGR